MRFTLDELAEAVSGAISCAPEGFNRPITSLTWDSRNVGADALYVALAGQRVDGHDFIADAASSGASCILASRDLDDSARDACLAAGCAVVSVADTAQAVVDLARAWRNRISGRVIGITGSTGKTTTKNLVRDVLAASGPVCATKGNQNNELGVPATVLASHEDDANVVVEMGMRGLHQLEELCDYVRPAWGLVTNVGESHIELLGSRENIAKAKSEMLASLEKDGIAFINAADDMADTLIAFSELNERGVAIVFFDGSDKAVAHMSRLRDAFPASALVWAEDVSLDATGKPSFSLCAEGFSPAAGSPEVLRVPCALNLMGIHNVSNACSAAAVGLAAGMDIHTVACALASSTGEQGRQEVVRAESGLTVINDAYNANPDSMRASLATFASFDVPGERIAVLGDMGELGSFAPEAHRQVGRCASSANLDRLICVGELSRYIASGAKEAGMDSFRIICVADWNEALCVLDGSVTPDDVVLVKASHFMGLDRVAKGLVE